MIYQGTFKDRFDNEYTVKITTDGDASRVTTLTLGTPPFTTSMDSEGDTLYKTAKYQSATITYVSRNEYYNMYAAKAQQNKVELFKDEKLEWVGYVEPNAYNQDYEGYETAVEINAIDALSTLQYFKYKPIGEKKSVITFTQLINHLLKQCNAYNNWYISSNVKLDSASTTSLVDNLYISEQNFFDDKKDGETDDDVAWNMNEVLEEVAQFLNMTAIAWKDSVYFIDYDAIKHDVNQYWKYEVGKETPTLVNLAASKTIVGDDIAEGGQTVSVGDVYNKVSIKADNYTFDSIIPSIYDNLENITADEDNELKTSTNINNGMYGEVIKNPIGEKSSKENCNMIMMIDKTYNPQKKKFQAVNAVGVKYFKNPNYTCYRYDSNKNKSTVNYTESKSYKGAVIAKFFVQQLNNQISWWDYAFKELIGGKITLDDWMAKNEVSNLGFQKYVCLLNPLSNHTASSDIASMPFLETKTSDSTALFGGKNAYLLITGNYMYHVFEDDPYPIPSSQIDISEGRYAIDDGQAYMLARLQWGGKYWNGSSWTTSPSNFKIPYIVEGADKKARRADATMFKDNKFVNTVSWRFGLDEEGYCIKAPNDAIIAGSPTFTLYCPFDPNYHSTKSGSNKGQHYKMSRVFLKDFDVKAVVGDPTFSDAYNTDTVYTNVINNDYVNELNEISWKICTYDNKKPSFSAVAYKDKNNTYQYVDKTFSEATKEGEIGWENSDTDAPQYGQLKQEEHMIYRLVNQYSQPSINLSFTINLQDITPWAKMREKFMSSKDFIIDEFSIDFENASTNLSLIEKR